MLHSTNIYNSRPYGCRSNIIRRRRRAKLRGSKMVNLSFDSYAVAFAKYFSISNNPNIRWDTPGLKRVIEMANNTYINTYDSSSDGSDASDRSDLTEADEMFHHFSVLMRKKDLINKKLDKDDANILVAALNGIIRSDCYQEEDRFVLIKEIEKLEGAPRVVDHLFVV